MNILTDLLVKAFVKNHEQTDDAKVRTSYGTFAGITGIVCNILLSLSKLVIGILSKSISITADAVNGKGEPKVVRGARSGRAAR